MRSSLAVFAVACAAAMSPAQPQSASPPGDQVRRSLRTAYLALPEQRLVPADPRTIASAALAVMSPSAALPSDFGADPGQDADGLAGQAGKVAAPWDTINAMARAAAIAHMGLVTPNLRRAMRVLAGGRPLTMPGFGVHRLPDGRTVVSDVVPGDSAERSGLRVGDVLTRIGDERIARQSTVVMPLMARVAGDTVPLEIERDRRAMRLELRMVDAQAISVESRMLDDGLAYVRIRWFSRSDDPLRDTAALAIAAFKALAQQGAKGLILDLRSALGESGEVAVASALADGDIIYYTQQAKTKPLEPARRVGARVWSGGPVVLLVNEQTVSAGEALALSLRELAQAPNVGQTTAGGLTEFSPVKLSSEYSLIIPTGLALGPVTRADQPGHAVRPDIERPNAIIDELVQRREPQLLAARGAIAEAIKRGAGAGSVTTGPEGRRSCHDCRVDGSCGPS